MTPVTPQAEAPSTNQKTSSGHLFENQLQPVLQNGSKCIELYSSIFHNENTEIDNSRRSWNVEVWRFHLSKRWTRPRIFQIFRKINKLFEVRSLPGHFKPNPGKNIQTHRISGNEIQDAWQFQRMSENSISGIIKSWTLQQLHQFLNRHFLALWKFWNIISTAKITNFVSLKPSWSSYLTFHKS